MTLIIACMLASQMGAPWWAYVLICFTWVIHVIVRIVTTN